MPGRQVDQAGILWTRLRPARRESIGSSEIDDAGAAAANACSHRAGKGVCHCRCRSSTASWEGLEEWAHGGPTRAEACPCIDCCRCRSMAAMAL